MSDSIITESMVLYEEVVSQALYEWVSQVTARINFRNTVD